MKPHANGSVCGHGGPIGKVLARGVAEEIEDLITKRPEMKALKALKRGHGRGEDGAPHGGGIASDGGGLWIAGARVCHEEIGHVNGGIDARVHIEIRKAQPKAIEQQQKKSDDELR